MGSCKWGITLKKSCNGHPQVCGPWNGRCSAREAFLSESGRPEPKSPDDLKLNVEGDALMMLNVERFSPSADLDPVADLEQRMAEFRHKHPKWDFHRRRRI